MLVNTLKITYLPSLNSTAVCRHTRSESLGVPAFSSSLGSAVRACLCACVPACVCGLNRQIDIWFVKVIYSTTLAHTHGVCHHGNKSCSLSRLVTSRILSVLCAQSPVFLPAYPPVAWWQIKHLALNQNVYCAYCIELDILYSLNTPSKIHLTLLIRTKVIY